MVFFREMLDRSNSDILWRISFWGSSKLILPSLVVARPKGSKAATIVKLLVFKDTASLGRGNVSRVS